MKPKLTWKFLDSCGKTNTAHPIFLNLPGNILPKLKKQNKTKPSWYDTKGQKTNPFLLKKQHILNHFSNNILIYFIRKVTLERAHFFPVKSPKLKKIKSYRKFKILKLSK